MDVIKTGWERVWCWEYVEEENAADECKRSSNINHENQCRLTNSVRVGGVSRFQSLGSGHNIFLPGCWARHEDWLTRSWLLKCTCPGWGRPGDTGLILFPGQHREKELSLPVSFSFLLVQCPFTPLWLGVESSVHLVAFPRTTVRFAALPACAGWQLCSWYPAYKMRGNISIITKLFSNWIQIKQAPYPIFYFGWSYNELRTAFILPSACLTVCQCVHIPFVHLNIC